jgi:hypothetical protein
MGIEREKDIFDTQQKMKEKAFALEKQGIPAQSNNS